MIVTKKDKQGKIIAYAEYLVVDSFGHQCGWGQYVWVNDAWVHKDYKNSNILKEFVKKEHAKLPWVKYIYWHRGKYSDRMSCYKIRRLYGRVNKSCDTRTTCTAVNSR